MAIFYRIYDNVIKSAGEVEKLGFPENDASYIPDDYLERGEFILLRTCHSLGD